jgi:hypothetical protein
MLSKASLLLTESLNATESTGCTRVVSHTTQQEGMADKAPPAKTNKILAIRNIPTKRLFNAYCAFL